jgi:cell wall-associated NlpC family hydrolase
LFYITIYEIYRMNRVVLIILLSLSLGFGHATQALAGEVLSRNAAGVAVISVDDAYGMESTNIESNSAESNNAETIKIEASDNNTNDTVVTPTSWQVKTQEVLIKALSLTGIKYTWGGKSPETGFDCSGFVSYVFRHAVNLSLPASALALSQIGKTVTKNELQPGDLVFFNTLQSTFSHVGIYIGDNKFIHAPRTGRTVSVASLKNSYWASHFTGAQRLEKLAEKSAPN